MEVFCKADANPLGPAHEYVPPPVDERLSVVPAQTGLLLEAVAEGFALTVTATVALEVHPEEYVTVNVYVPVMEVVALDLEGFCCEEV